MNTEDLPEVLTIDETRASSGSAGASHSKGQEGARSPQCASADGSWFQDPGSSLGWRESRTAAHEAKRSLPGV
jgi:hypothetical protein